MLKAQGSKTTANIGLAVTSVLVVNGNKCFFNYFADGLKGSADHPQMRQAGSVSGNGRATLQTKNDLE